MTDQQVKSDQSSNWRPKPHETMLLLGGMSYSDALAKGERSAQRAGESEEGGMTDQQVKSDQNSVVTADGTIWVGDAADPMDGPVVLENDPVAVNVERTDVNEVAIHATLPGDDNAVVSIYVSRITAVGLAKLLEMKATR